MMKKEIGEDSVPSDDQRWLAVVGKDRGSDGTFVFAVTSTGIYCRPSCPARRPGRDKVRFFNSGKAASEAGFRACKRCLPDDVSREEHAVAKALSILASEDCAVSLEELAGQVGYSPTHFQRLFKGAVGMSPSAYSRALRAERAADALSRGDRVTDAVYEAGYGASSRFYESGKERMGMPPSAWRKGGAGVTIRWVQVATSMGPILVAATDKGVCRLSFEEGQAELAARFPNADLEEGGEEFSVLVTQVVSAVEQPVSGQSIPLDVRGTAFQEAVWAELRKIPAGETRSYGEIAAAIGKPGAVRAAGSANGANHVAVLIPCHRVVRSDGTIGGYVYGEDIKRDLLSREARETPER